MILNPDTTDEASMVAAECIFSEVEGEDVDIGRFDIEAVLDGDAGGIVCFVGARAEGGCVKVVITGFAVELGMPGLSCVCILVFTTSSGHVNTPAKQPADAPVKTSSRRPMSLFPTHALAIFCSCS
jgi:hypothetical protein